MEFPQLEIYFRFRLREIDLRWMLQDRMAPRAAA